MAAQGQTSCCLSGCRQVCRINMLTLPSSSLLTSPTLLSFSSVSIHLLLSFFSFLSDFVFSLFFPLFQLSQSKGHPHPPPPPFHQFFPSSSMWRCTLQGKSECTFTTLKAACHLSQSALHNANLLEVILLTAKLHQQSFKNEQPKINRNT